MARHFGWILAAALLCMPGAAAAHSPCDAVQSGADNKSQQSRRDERRPRFVKWWVEQPDRGEIGISDQQSAKIEEIWRTHVPAQRERWRELEKLEPVVSQLIKDGTADPVDVEKQVERMETLDAQMRAARTMMLYRIHRELTADQRARLKAISERRDAERRKDSKSDSTRRQ
jgi:Spy/CpxP family protein refolding chaperone